MKLKVIFLDIDGVMRSNSSTIKNTCNGMDVSSYLLHPEHVEALNCILKHTDARIVVSSTYRICYSVEELKQLFDESGIDYKYVISSTPFINREYIQRGHEIRAWLKKLPDVAGHKYEIDNFVVIDDDVDMKGIDPKNFIKTNANYGLTYVEALKAINVLNGKPLFTPKIIKRGN